MNLRSKLVGWLVPSAWVEWLNGRKRILGVVAFALWAVIYGIPIIYPQWGWVAGYGNKIASFLSSLGIELDSFLVDAGTGLTLVGLLDWILDHVPSKQTVKILKAAEKPFKLEK